MYVQAGYRPSAPQFFSVAPGWVRRPQPPQYFSRAPRVIWRGAIARGVGDLNNAQLAKSTGAIAGASIMALAPLAGPAAPFVALAGLAVSGLSNLFASVFSGCGPTCTQATQIVNQVEAQYLKPNLQNYFALPVRTQAAQQAALQVFDYGWSLVLQGCGNPSLGDAGVRCISERQAGGSIPNHPGVNWFTLYRDPIANDPSVVPNPSPAASSPAGPASTVGGDVLQAFGVNPSTPVAGVALSDLLVPLALIGVGLSL